MTQLLGAVSLVRWFDNCPYLPRPRRGAGNFGYLQQGWEVIRSVVECQAHKLRCVSSVESPREAPAR